jgi:hypothetical protein
MSRSNISTMTARSAIRGLGALGDGECRQGDQEQQYFRLEQPGGRT